MIVPPGEQRVEQIAGGTQQDIGPVVPTPARGSNQRGKVTGCGGGVPGGAAAGGDVPLEGGFSPHDKVDAKLK